MFSVFISSWITHFEMPRPPPSFRATPCTRTLFLWLNAFLKMMQSCKDYPSQLDDTTPPIHQKALKPKHVKAMYHFLDIALGLDHSAYTLALRSRHRWEHLPEIHHLLPYMRSSFYLHVFRYWFSRLILLWPDMVDPLDERPYFPIGVLFPWRIWDTRVL